MKYIYEAKPSKKENESGIYRSPLCKGTGSLMTVFGHNDVTNVVELIQEAIQNYGDNNALGYREVIKVHHEKKEVNFTGPNGPDTKIKTFNYPELSSYRWLTYNEMEKVIKKLSGAFGSLGLSHQNKVAFYAPTSHYWLLMAFGLFHQNATVATIYDTLGEEGLLHGIEQCESTALFLSSDQFPTLKNIYKRAKNLTTIFYTGELSEKADLQSEFPGLKFYSWDQLLDLGEQNPHDTIQPKPNDLAVIMYTSGSTGPPKGVMMEHTQFVTSGAGMRKMVENTIQDDDIYVTFLPLAHILSLESVFCFLERGVPTGFATPRTLMDSGVRHCRGDLCELRPTLISGVPQIYDTIRKSIGNQIRSAGPIVSFLFWSLVMLKKLMIQRGINTNILDNFIFKTLLSSVGGRLRLGVSGGAPLSPEVSDFFNLALFPIIQGYGMTETCGLGSLVVPGSDMPGRSSGQISPTLEMKLVDVPDAGYFHSDMTGELLLRGNNIFKGYYKNSEATEGALTKDGWLRTGDVVKIDSSGCLMIIDRIKNLVKLANGEYIALEKLESTYSDSEYVRSICLVANSHLRQPVAVIQPNFVALASLATSLSLPAPRPGNPIDPQLNQNVLRSLLSIATRHKLNSSEKLAALHLSSVEFTPENSLITASGKLNRRGIQSHFEKEIDSMYKQVE